MHFSIVPTFECGHNCSYCLVDKSILSKENISEDEVCLRLRKTLTAIKKLRCENYIEVLLGDDETNKYKKLHQEILENADCINSIVMNDFDADFGKIPVLKHALSIEDCKKSADRKVFVVTADNYKELSEDSLNECLNTFFILDSSLKDEKIKTDIREKFKSHFLATNTTICLNHKYEYDLILDKGLISFSCSAKKSHICGYIDFDKEELVFTNKKCSIKCEYYKMLC